MATLHDLTSGWETYKIVQRDGRGGQQLPFSDALASSGELPIAPLTKMRMVQQLGWPEAKRRLKDNHGHSLIVKKDDVIWLLKCKPSCWRLYFYVFSQTRKQLIYVHAICKKASKEDPQSANEARRLADEIMSGRSAITAFEFPPG